VKIKHTDIGYLRQQTVTIAVKESISEGHSSELTS